MWPLFKTRTVPKPTLVTYTYLEVMGRKGMVLMEMCYKTMNSHGQVLIKYRKLDV